MNTAKLVLLASLSLPACGGHDKGPVGRQDPLTTTVGLCQAWAEAACNAEVVHRCSATSVDACVTAQAAYCADLIGEGPFVAAEAKACIADVKAAYADSEIDYEEWQNVILGASGTCAVLNPPAGGQGGAGSGGPALYLVGGSDCDPADDRCEPSHYCDDAHGFGYCKPRAIAGEACCENDPLLVTPVCSPVPCDVASYCDGASGSQTCVSLGGLTDECTTDAQCGSGLFCVDGADRRICTDTVFLGTGTPLCDDLR